MRVSILIQFKAADFELAVIRAEDESNPMLPKKNSVIGCGAGLVDAGMALIDL